MGQSRLLVVDDEKSLLELLTRYLLRLGYQVCATSDSREALDFLSRDAAAYQGVILDLNMPGISGEEMLRKILAEHRGLRVLVSSGYPFSPEVLPAGLQKRVGYLQKPYSPKMLGDAVEALLGA